MSRYLVIEVRDHLAATMAAQLILGLEFTGQRVGARLKIRELDEESAICAIQDVVTTHTRPGSCEHDDGEHCTCNLTSWEIASQALAAVLARGTVRAA